MSNAAGNTNKDVRRFLREHGVKPTVGNVERIGREVRRSQSENERVERIAKESGQRSELLERSAKIRDAMQRRIAEQQRQR